MLFLSTVRCLSYFPSLFTLTYSYTIPLFRFLREGKVLGSEKGKDVDFITSRGEKLNRGFTAYDRN
jgi:hypothetical protein